MSKPLDAILAIAEEGSDLTCTLSPESVQVILFALSFIENKDAWRSDFFDTVSDVEWSDIRELISDVSQEMLP